MDLTLIQGQLHRWWIRFTKPIRHAWNRPQSLLKYTAFLAFMGVCFYAFALVGNLFTIPLSGDYVLQQIPFYFNGYDDWWHFFRTGEFLLWDHSTYLGSNYIGSNSFYYYLNPFFLPILIFPRALVPQGLAVLMIGKMVLAALTFRLYLRFLGVKEQNSRLFAMAYGFSGWMSYYLWFNHFMEVAVVFPLVLLGIEKLIKQKDFKFLAFAIFLMGITNYFFLVSTAFTAAFYALFRFFQTISKRKIMDSVHIAGIGVLAFAVGIMMSAFVFLPSVMVAVTSNRVDEAWYLDQLITSFEAEDWQRVWRLLTVWMNQSGLEEPYNQFYPLISFLFPTVSNRSSTLFRTGRYDNTISSLFMYTPLTLLLVPSIIHSLKQKKISHIIGLGLVLFMLFTPITYQLVHGFTIDYGRWQIFIVAIAIAYIAQSYEAKSSFKPWYFDVSFVVIFGLALYVFNVAIEYQNQFFFTAMEERQYVAYVTFAYMLVAFLFLRRSYRKRNLTETLKQAVFVEAVVMGTLIMNMHSLISYPNRIDNGLRLVNDQRAIVEKMQTQDQDFYRVYNLNAGESTNLGMRLGYNGVTAFHSLYNFHVMDFNNYSRMNYNYKGWSMGYHEKRYNLDTFLGIKYYIMQNEYDSFTRSNVINPETGRYDYYYQNVPHGFVKDETLSTSINSVYVNTNFIHGGFTFDRLYPTNQMANSRFNDFFINSRTEVLDNEEAYLTGAILSNTDIDMIVEDAPHLVVESKPFSNIARIQANVSVAVCDDIFTDIYPGPTGRPILEGCTFNPVSVGQPITNFNGEKNTIHLTPVSGQNFGQADLYFFALQLNLSHYSTVYFLDEQNDIIVRDAHSFVNTDPFYGKFMRGYYPTRPVARIVIVPKFFSGNMAYPTLHRERYTDYLTRLEMHTQFPLENYTYTENTMAFTTNFEQSRFIVLNTAYDPGWKVTRIDGNNNRTSVPVYKAQGGFVSFVSGTGQTRYEVRYWTPYLTEGLWITLAGLSIFGGVIGATYWIQKRKRTPADA